MSMDLELSVPVGSLKSLWAGQVRDDVAERAHKLASSLGDGSPTTMEVYEDAEGSSANDR